VKLVLNGFQISIFGKSYYVFITLLRIHLILMRIRIRILDPHWKKWIRIQVISLRFTEFFKQKIIFKFFVLFFSPIFILKLELFKNENFYNLFFQKFRFEFRSKKSFFLQILVDILPLGSGSRKPESYGSNGSGS